MGNTCAWVMNCHPYNLNGHDQGSELYMYSFIVPSVHILNIWMWVITGLFFRSLITLT